MSVNQTILLLSEIRKMAQYVILPTVAGTVLFINRKKVKDYFENHSPKVRFYN